MKLLKSKFLLILFVLNHSVAMCSEDPCFKIIQELVATSPAVSESLDLTTISGELFLKSFKGSRRFVLNPDSSLKAMSIGEIPIVFILEIATGRILKIIKLRDSADIISWSPDGEKLAICEYRHLLPKIYDTKDFSEVLTLKLIPSSEQAKKVGLEQDPVAFHFVTPEPIWSSDSRYMGWFGHEASLAVVDTETGDLVKFLGTHKRPDWQTNGVYSAKFHPQDPNLLVVSYFSGSHQFVQIRDEDFGLIRQFSAGLFWSNLFGRRSSKIERRSSKSLSIKNIQSTRTHPKWYLLAWSSDGNYLPMVRWKETSSVENESILIAEIKILNRQGEEVTRQSFAYRVAGSSMGELPLNRLIGFWDEIGQFWLMNNIGADLIVKWNPSTNIWIGEETSHFVNGSLSSSSPASRSLTVALTDLGGVLLQLEGEMLKVKLSASHRSRWRNSVLLIDLKGKLPYLHGLMMKDVKFEGISPDGVLVLSITERPSLKTSYIYVKIEEQMGVVPDAPAIEY